MGGEVRILFINHVFPGQFGTLAASFARNTENEVFFMSGYSRRGFSLQGVKQIILPTLRDKKKNEKTDLSTEAEKVLRTARQARKSFFLLRQNGFRPDMVVLNAAWAYWLYGPEIFPDAFVVSYLETFPNPAPCEDHFNADFFQTLLQTRQILLSHLCISRTLGEESPYAQTLRTAVALPYPVDTEFFSPQIGEELWADHESPIVFVSTDAESLDHLLMMTCTVLTRLPKRRISLLISDAKLRGRAREKLQYKDLGSEQRLSLPEAMPLREYRNLLRTAAAVVFADSRPRSDFLLEAMSCGAVVILCSTTDLPEVFQHGWNIIKLEQQDLTTQLESLLLNHIFLRELRLHARNTILKYFSHGEVIEKHTALIESTYKEWCKNRYASNVSPE